jgi:hypothetical protein
MFAIAARYDQAELPPLDPGNLWEAGLEYMVQAREVLSMPLGFLSGGAANVLTLPRPRLSLLQRNYVPSPLTSRITGIS